MIIVCDGDCAPFTAKTSLWNYSARSIAEDFLRQRLHNSIDLVLLATVDDREGARIQGNTVLSMRYDLVAGPPSARHTRLSGEVVSALEKALRDVLCTLPAPV